MNTMTLLTINFPVNTIVHNYVWLFVLSILSFSLIIILRSSIYGLIEVILLAFLFSNLGDIAAIFYPFMVLQVTLPLILLFNLFRTINDNYQRVLEKTHQVPRKITRHNYTGL